MTPQEILDKMYFTGGREKFNPRKDDRYYEQRPPRVPAYLPQFNISHEKYEDRDVIYAAIHLLCTYGILRAMGEAHKADRFLHLVENIVAMEVLKERMEDLDLLLDPSMKNYRLRNMDRAECKRDAVFHASWAWRRLRLDLQNGFAHDLERLCLMVFPMETWTAEIQKRCPP